MSPRPLISRLESLYRHLDEEGWYVHANTVALAIEALQPTRALEELQMARDLMQEAKGIEGPKGGSVTDHLDAAENWLDRVEEHLRS